MVVKIRVECHGRWTVGLHMARMASFQAARLLAGNPAANLILQEAYVAIVNNQKAGQLIKCLTYDLPMGCLQHLKRIRKASTGQNLVEVLLCARGQKQEQSDVDAANAPQQQQQHLCLYSQQTEAPRPQEQQLEQLAGFPAKTAQLLQECNAEISTCLVPISQPVNKEQWQQWCEIWPMPWRKVSEDTQLDNQPPSAADQQYFERCMAKVLAAAAATGGRNAALIVDPASGDVMGEAVDCSLRHPFDHAAMVAVEAVAARDRRLWPYNGFAHVGRHHDSPDTAGYVAVAPAHHSRAAIGGSSSSDDRSRPCKKQKSADSSNPTQMPEPAAVATVDAAAAAAAAAVAEAGDSGSTNWARKPYLCTGFDCFLLREPCTMCAMALVHSRLSRVVYCIPNTTQGALGGSYRLHAQRSLNHHYKVYQLPLMG